MQWSRTVEPTWLLLSRGNTTHDYTAATGSFQMSYHGNTMVDYWCYRMDIMDVLYYQPVTDVLPW